MDYITTANVLLWVFLTLGFLLVFLSHWLVAAALFPSFVDRCASQYRRPVLATLLGLLALTVPIAGGIALLNGLPPLLKWIGLMVIFAPVLGALAGTAGLALRIGRGMPAPGDVSGSWRCVLRGGTALALTFLLPVLGQVLAIPLILASGLGAALMTWSSRHPRTPALPAPVIGESGPGRSSVNPFASLSGAVSFMPGPGAVEGPGTPSSLPGTVSSAAGHAVPVPLPSPG